MFVLKIKELRTALGKSQSEIAKLSGLSQTQISNLERNLTSTTLATLERIANSLECCVFETFYHECDNCKKCSKCGKCNKGAM